MWLSGHSPEEVEKIRLSIVLPLDFSFQPPSIHFFKRVISISQHEARSAIMSTKGSPPHSRQRRRRGRQREETSRTCEAPPKVTIASAASIPCARAPSPPASVRPLTMRQRRRRCACVTSSARALALFVACLSACVCRPSRWPSHNAHVLAFGPQIFVSNRPKSYSRHEHEVLWSSPPNSSNPDDASKPLLFVDRTPDGSRINTIPADANDSLLVSFDRVRRSILGSDAVITNGETAAVVASDANVKRINMAIVERGQLFASASTDVDADSSAVIASNRERVPGCVATVHVRTTLRPLSVGTAEKREDAPNPSCNYGVVIDGDADALLSRGLLALLSDALSGDGVTAQDILNLEPESVADLLGLRAVLSTGRNDGLASMTGVVQNQIRQGLGLVSKDYNADALAANDVSRSNGEKRPTVAMLLSGGVDSSVALNLLVREGYDVTAFYLKIWLEDELSHLGQCPWEDDYSVCQAVCEQVGVPLETVSLQNEYKDRVISYTVEEARKGRTPNPDIMCNSRVKFGCFYDAIEGRGFDYVASGHYAQLVEGDEDENGQKQMRLLRAPDPVKDQTYFLCALTQEQLSKVKFPIGSFLKSEVRGLAQQFQLPNRNRPDSQGLCFLGKVKFDEFINAYLGTNPGDIVDATTGRVIGRHNGLWYHTVGQRKGIGKVLNPKETAKGPWYIVAKDQEKNIVIASNEYDQEAFEEARSDFFVEDITWTAGSPPERLVHDGIDDKRWKDGRFTMKIRHGPTMVNGTLTLDGSDPEAGSGNVHLETKDKGLAPGQYCVFYNVDDDECLGAGVISERHWAKLLLETGQAEKVAEKEGAQLPR